MSQANDRRTGSIPTAVGYSGISRSKLYEIAATHPGLFRKLGKSVLVDFERLDQIIDSLPDARIKPTYRAPRRATAAVTSPGEAA